MNRRRPAPWPALSALGLVVLCSLPSPSPAGPAAAGPGADATPLPLAADAGQALLLRSRQRADFGPLSQEFLTQSSLSYCGVASAVMVLNSLAVPSPAASGYGPYRFWTQENLFEGGQGGPDPASVRRRGMTLAQLRELLAGRGVRAEAIEADRLTLAELRRLLRRSLADPSDRLLVNYDRRAVGQSGGGHISPLAAFDDSSDRVLILDVARYRYPAAWVPLPQLLEGMRRIDRDSGRSRGLVRVSPAALARPMAPANAAPAAASPPGAP